MGERELRAPTFAESVAIDNYKAAVQGALASTNGAGEKLATAAVSVATAYGAVLALVTPKESTTPVIVAIPFAAFAVALVLGLWTQSLGISLEPSDAIDTVQTDVEALVSRKRWLNRLALIFLGVGLVVAGAIVADRYQPVKKLSATTALVTLTRTGSVEVKRTCKTRTATIAGNVDIKNLGDTWVRIGEPMPRCPGASGAIVLPPRDVASIKIAH